MAEPVVEMRWLSSEPSQDGWRVTWEVRNGGADALRLDSAYAPHATFRAPEREIGAELAPGRVAKVELVARVRPTDDAAPNPFLALRLSRADGPWLVLARLAVTERDGRPEAVPTRITVQRKGFSRDTEARDDDEG